MLRSAFSVLTFVFIWTVDWTVTGAATCPRIVSRSDWRARSPTSVTSIHHPIPRVFIHHTVTGTCSTQTSCSAAVRSMQNQHMDSNGWSDIGYNFLVGNDGNVYEGRGWNRVGAQTYNYNSVSIGIAFIGNFNSHLPNGRALNAAKQLIACGVSQNKLSSSYTLHGHRDAYCTECPGQRLYDLIKSWSHYGGRLPGHC